MITIGAVNYHSQDWAELLAKSVHDTTTEKYEIIIWDNSGDLEPIEGVDIIKTDKGNIGHGAGIDEIVFNCHGDQILALDIDAHILRAGWDKDILEIFKTHKMVAAKGGPLKPYRPCVMFFDVAWFKKNKMTMNSVRVEANNGFFTLDAGVYLAMKAMHDHGEKSVYPLDVGPKYYDGAWGDTYHLNHKPTFYHNWYGTRFADGQPELDGFKRETIMEAKRKLFEQV